MYDLVIKGAKVVRPGFPDEILDIGVQDGRFAEIGPDLMTDGVASVVDGRGKASTSTINNFVRQWTGTELLMKRRWRRL